MTQTPSTFRKKSTGFNVLSMHRVIRVGRHLIERRRTNCRHFRHFKKKKGWCSLSCVLPWVEMLDENVQLPALPISLSAETDIATRFWLSISQSRSHLHARSLRSGSLRERFKAPLGCLN